MTSDELDFLPLKVTHVDEGGRRCFDPDGKRRLIEACEQPGASVAGLALKAGVNANQLRKWILLERRRAVRSEIRRQQAEWSRQASREIARGDFRQGLDAYHERGHVRMLASRDEAREALVSAWMQDREKAGTQAIMAHENRDVRALNEAVREARRDAGELGDGQRVSTERGVREFAQGDRLVFLKNDRTLEVRNGSPGAVGKADGDAMQVRLDTGRTVNFNTQDYGHIDHGYALTIHKEQGATVDRTHVLATPGMDRSLSYVAMTRHREEATLYAGRDDFRSYGQLSGRLERQQARESTLDYGGSYGPEAQAAPATQDEGKDEVSRDFGRSGEPQREAQAGRQQDAVGRALANAREQREQREAQGGSRDAVEQALARSREQREAQGDFRQDATERALAHSREQREAGQQAGPAGPETADHERSDRGASGERMRNGEETGRNDFRSHGQLSERQSFSDSHLETPAVTASQDERKGELSQEPQRSGEPHQSREGGPQQEAQAGGQLGSIEQALEHSREQRAQREAQGGSRDAVGQALARSREEREAGQQAGPAGLEAADDERSAAAGALARSDQEAVDVTEPMENQQERHSEPEMGD
jgi:transposase-like protein